MKLFEYLDKLGDYVLYYDTDSCGWVNKENERYEPELGNFLGRMTDELANYGKGSFIEIFLSGGPKFTECVL